jgi:hypothetical protein
MTIRHKTTTFLVTSALSALVAGAVPDGVTAADLQLQPRARSAPHAENIPPGKKSGVIQEKKNEADASDVTGSIEWPTGARASLSPATAAISYSYAARASFAKARAAMESGILLREDVPKSNFASLENATEDVLSELKALELVMRHRPNEGIRKAMTLVQDWHETGLKIIKPPVEGVTALPFPATVAARANAVSAALDQLIVQANAFAPPNRSRQRSDLQIRSSGSMPAAPSQNRTLSQ